MRRSHFLILLTGTLVMMLVMAKTGAPLKTAGTPNGIIDLEFAWNTGKVTAVINDWKNVSGNYITIAKINTELDFIFILFYSLFLHLACKTIARLYENAAQNIGMIISGGAIAAGVFDVIENAGMLLTLHGYRNHEIPLTTFIFSASKWMLIVTSLIYLITGGGWFLLRKSRKSKITAGQK